MPAFIQLAPKFSFNRDTRSTWMYVPEGIFTLKIEPFYVTFRLDQTDGVVLSSTCSQSELNGAMPPHDPYSDMDDETGAKKRQRDSQFYRDYNTDPEKLARGVVLTNLRPQQSYHLQASDGRPSLNLIAGVAQEYTPFPAEHPSFSVKLTLLSE